MRHSFEKISIKMIVDGADIRRPSFYNHFLDKHDLLEWIVCADVVTPAQKALDAGTERDAIRTLFEKILHNEVFYRKAFGVTGQNSFEEAFVRQLIPLMESAMARSAHRRPQPAPLSERDLATCYALGLVTGIKVWLLKGIPADVDTMMKVTGYLAANIPFPADDAGGLAP